MIKTFDAIVLSIIDYKDNDEILKVYTQEYGLLSIISKSSKKLTSKRHFLVSFSYSFEIDYKHTTTIFTLINSNPSLNNFDIENYKLLIARNYICELLYTFSNSIENIFDETKKLIEFIDNKNLFMSLTFYTKIILDKLGILPHIDGCLICKSKQVVDISIDGGFLCKNHTNSNISIDRLKKFHYVNASNKIEKLLSFNFDLIDFSLEYQFIRNYLNHDLNSYILLKTI